MVHTLSFWHFQKQEVMSEDVDAFFLVVMGCIVFCECSISLSMTMTKLGPLSSSVMQAGFAFVEAGSVRSKNTTNILTKNLLDSAIAAVRSKWGCFLVFIL